MSITDLVIEVMLQWENNPALTPEELCREHESHPEHAVLLEAVKLAMPVHDVEHVKKDDDLKALRKREDFKELVAELEAASLKKP